MASRRIQQGTVTHYDADRGQGEILTERGESFAVHRSALQDETHRGLFPGDIVEFVAGRNRYGHPAALEVRRVGWEDEDDGPGEWTF